MDVNTLQKKAFLLNNELIKYFGLNEQIFFETMKHLKYKDYRILCLIFKKDYGGNLDLAIVDEFSMETYNLIYQRILKNERPKTLKFKLKVFLRSLKKKIYKNLKY